MQMRKRLGRLSPLTQVYKALRKAFDEGVVKREDVFITSKVFNNKHLDRVPSSCEQTLKVTCQPLNLVQDLQLSYIDLLLVHWPIMFEVSGIAIPLPGFRNCTANETR